MFPLFKLDGLKQLQACMAFYWVPRSKRSVVFYAEGRRHWPHLQPILTALLTQFNEPVCYLTSDKADPAFAYAEDAAGNFQAFWIGEGLLRTLVLNTLSTEVFVTSLPDLNTFYLKRSPQVKHAVYVHHSLVSTHMVYNPAAFDAFDAVFCSGKHHIEEIRARENQCELPAKLLFPHGYGRLDTLLQNNQILPNQCQTQLMQARQKPQAEPDDAVISVLLAPSWGKNAILESLGERSIQPLLDAGFHVILRPHPETKKRSPDILARICNQYQGHSRFQLDDNVAGHASLQQSALMISDWSGAALDYAFAYEKPVLFIDVPRKVNNPDYQTIRCEPLEVKIREQIGTVISPDNLEAMPAAIHQLLDLCPGGESLAKNAKKSKKSALHKVRGDWVFNLGHSGSVGARYIQTLRSEGNGLKTEGFEVNLEPEPYWQELRWLIAGLVSPGKTPQETPSETLSVPVSIDVPGFLAQLYENPGQIASDPVLQSNLFRLSKKLDLGQTINTTYDKNWKKTADQSPLLHYYWPILLLALLTLALHHQKNSSDDLAVCMKLLNSVFKGLDQYQSLSTHWPYCYKRYLMLANCTLSRSTLALSALNAALSNASAFNDSSIIQGTTRHDTHAQDPSINCSAV
ncbi:MAG: hypothetical protein AAGI66_04400 [Cyanobacteria bacterium P01_H01_bin.74]